ncbi:MAG: hypothetical protein IT423_20130 [Pirellulaceae bacterium]|nr:hypothetical protein [Pirellulaceae bacterium]
MPRFAPDQRMVLDSLKVEPSCLKYSRSGKEAATNVSLMLVQPGRAKDSGRRRQPVPTAGIHPALLRRRAGWLPMRMNIIEPPAAGSAKPSVSTEILQGQKSTIYNLDQRSFDDQQHLRIGKRTQSPLFLPKLLYTIFLHFCSIPERRWPLIHKCWYRSMEQKCVKAGGTIGLVERHA